MHQQGFAHQLKRGGGKRDILSVVDVEQGVWVLQGSQWVKQRDVPKDLRTGWNVVCVCAVVDGFVAMSRAIRYTNQVCYYYSLSDDRWRKGDCRIETKGKYDEQIKKTVEISPMMVMAVTENNEGAILDVRRGKWSMMKLLPESFREVWVAAADGRVFILGENQYDDNCQLHEYYAASDSYSSILYHVSQFHPFDMALVAGKLYLFGSSTHFEIATQHFVEYDITTGDVTGLPLPEGCYPTGCCITVRGESLLLCGSSYRSGKCVQEYNTITMQWKTLDGYLPFKFSRKSSCLANISI